MLKDIVKVTGRGVILVCDDEGFKPGDKITLEIKGVERIRPSGGNVGLIVSKNIEKEAK